MPKLNLSLYDTPGPIPNDPLPVDGVDPLTPLELAHYRIEQELRQFKALHHSDSLEWRGAFNHLAANVKKAIGAFEANQLALGTRIANLELRMKLQDGKKVKKR